jgi:hypothetical protein
MRLDYCKSRGWLTKKSEFRWFIFREDQTANLWLGIVCVASPLPSLCPAILAASQTKPGGKGVAQGAGFIGGFHVNQFGNHAEPGGR